MADYGFGAVNKNLNTKNDNNLKNSLGFTISTGRVVSIILDGDDYLGVHRFCGIRFMQSIKKRKLRM